ncbi:MAG TPA: STAS domain-containing protein [Gemmataceae bacterium]|nr:STAS domain-containing protein [Gemmataceae bacterium]
MSTQPRTRWLEAERVGTVTVVRFTCPEIWGADMVAEIGRRLERLAEAGGHRLLLHFGGVQRLDSTMLGAVVGLHKQVRAAGGRLALCGLSRELREVFDILQLNRLLAIYEGPEEALQTF